MWKTQGLLLIILMFFVNNLHAAPVGNFIQKEEPALIREEDVVDDDFKKNIVELSYIVDYVFDRELENNNGEIDEFIGNFIKISYPWRSNIRIYGLLGLVQYQLEETQPEVKMFETRQDFAWGVGSWIHLFKTARNMSIDIDGKFRRSDGNIDSITGATGEGALYEDWQVAFVVSKPLNGVTPYGGIKYSDVNISGPGTFAEQSSDYHLGTFFGMKFDSDEEMLFIIEARFIDELAMSAQISYQF